MWLPESGPKSNLSKRTHLLRPTRREVIESGLGRTDVVFLNFERETCVSSLWPRWLRD